MTRQNSKTYDIDLMNDRFEALSNPKKVEVLTEALDIMQGYNGQSTARVIALAMEDLGYGIFEE
jgi:predicted metallopeptidase